MILDIDKFLGLMPDNPYDVSVGSNNFKMIELLVEEFNTLAVVAQQIADLVDIDNVFGASLDLLATEYGLSRNGQTDEELRTFILAKEQNTVDGNTIENVINYFSLFISPITNIVLTELFNSNLGSVLDGLSPLDGTQLLEGGGAKRPGAFNVDTGAITPALENTLTNALPILKSGGIEATVNLAL